MTKQEKRELRNQQWAGETSLNVAALRAAGKGPGLPPPCSRHCRRPCRTYRRLERQELQFKFSKSRKKR